MFFLFTFTLNLEKDSVENKTNKNKMKQNKTLLADAARPRPVSAGMHAKYKYVNKQTTARHAVESIKKLN